MTGGGGGGGSCFIWNTGELLLNIVMFISCGLMVTVILRILLSVLQYFNVVNMAILSNACTDFDEK